MTKTLLHVYTITSLLCMEILRNRIPKLKITWSWFPDVFTVLCPTTKIYSLGREGGAKRGPPVKDTRSKINVRGKREGVWELIRFFLHSFSMFGIHTVIQALKDVVNKVNALLSLGLFQIPFSPITSGDLVRTNTKKSLYFSYPLIQHTTDRTRI